MSFSFAELNPRSKSNKLDKDISRLRGLKPVTKDMAEVVDRMTGNLNGTPFYKLSKRRMANCCHELVKSTVEYKGTEQLEDRISGIKRCRVAICPLCCDKRTHIAKAVQHEVNKRLISEYPNDKFISMTLTVRHCKVDEISDTIKKLNKGLENLLSYKENKQFRIPKLGYIKFLHIRRNGRNRAHCHFHLLFHMAKNYKNELMPEPELQRLWMRAMKSEAPLKVDIQPLNSSVNSLTQYTNYGIGNGLQAVQLLFPEIEKNKTDELIKAMTTKEVGHEVVYWLQTYMQQTHRKWFITVGGTIKAIRKKGTTEYEKKKKREASQVTVISSEDIVEPYGSV